MRRLPPGLMSAFSVLKCDATAEFANLELKNYVAESVASMQTIDY